MALLDDVATSARSVPHLAVIPVLASLLAYEKIVKTSSAGPGGGMTFPMPAALPDLWTFVSVPSTGVSFELGVPLLLAPVFFVLQATLVAGYLGSRRCDRGRGSRLLGARRRVHAPRSRRPARHLRAHNRELHFALVGGMALTPLSALLALAFGT